MQCVWTGARGKADIPRIICQKCPEDMRSSMDSSGDRRSSCCLTGGAAPATWQKAIKHRARHISGRAVAGKGRTLMSRALPTRGRSLGLCDPFTEGPLILVGHALRGNGGAASPPGPSGQAPSRRVRGTLLRHQKDKTWRCGDGF